MATFEYEGNRYELPQGYSFREMLEIEKYTKLRGGKYFTELEDGNTKCIMARFWIALKRGGISISWDAMWDVDYVALLASAEEDAEVPPAQEAPQEKDAEPGKTEAATAN